MRLLALLVISVTSSMTTAKSVTSNGDDPQKLMLILFDGFRWDFVDKWDLPNFKRFYTKGGKAGRLINDFPTVSMPNYYTIVTGLHTESHGMTGNYLYDRTTGEEMLLGTNEDSNNLHWWEGATPIWVSIQKQGKKAYMYHWMGAELSIHGTRPKWDVTEPEGKPFNKTRLEHTTTEGLAVLRNGSADFVGIYFGEPDKAGHVYGPDSDQVKDKVTMIDGVLGQLLDQIEGQREDEKINLMVVSDHGMTAIDRSRTIDFSKELTSDLYVSIQERGALTTIYLKNESVQDEVYQKLVNFHPNMTVYKKQDIPDRFHYKHGRYVPLIVCVADLGYFIGTPTEPGYWVHWNNSLDMNGTHGYDNQEADMAGIFYAMGPYFQAGSSVESLQVVDLYEVMCRILAITPLPNNGTIQHMTPLLASSSQHLTLSIYIVGLLTFASGFMQLLT